MSHPTYWPKKVWFYPIGNSPALCLTQDLPPEENANILLLGCGDPRHILYTLHCNKNISIDRVRSLDFTCCDAEPAVLARNILLLSLVFDNHPNDSIWDIFFHLKISERVFSLLMRQCEKLEKLTKSLEEWTRSEYSPWLQFCSLDTLSSVHRLYRSYLDSQQWSPMKRKDLWSSIAKIYQDMSGRGGNSLSHRAGGPFSVAVTLCTQDHFEHFWKTGTTSRDSPAQNSPSLINPTFIHTQTRDECAVHYATYPLACFHLSEAFISCKSITKVKEGTLLHVAKTQFRTWCESTKIVLKKPSKFRVTIRLFAGDAMAFCKSLHWARQTGSLSGVFYSSVWQGKELELNPSLYGRNSTPQAPTLFNIIDASNVADHIGLLNLLPCTLPLLERSLLSTLYTEGTLGYDKTATDCLLRQLCVEIPIASILFGVLPRGYEEGFSSVSNTHELLQLHFLKEERIYDRIPWKVSFLDSRTIETPRISMDPVALGEILFKLYLNLFGDEDISKKLSIISSKKLPTSIIHYHRASFVALLGLVKSRLQVNWDRTMETLFDMIERDRSLIMGTNNYQEFCAQLYLHNIYSIDLFGLPPHRRASVSGANYTKGIFSTGWPNVPPIVCVVLTVPRKALAPLDNATLQNIGTPILQMHVKGHSYHNVFSAIQISCGRLIVDGSGQQAQATIEEDETGLLGKSPLLVSAWVSSHGLAVEPFTTQVCLAVHSTPTTVFLAKETGMELILFKTPLLDQKQAHVFVDRPGRLAEFRHRRQSSWLSPNLQSAALHFDPAPKTFTRRWENLHSFDLPSAKITTKQISPVQVGLYAGSSLIDAMLCPLPVDESKLRSRIARKSGWIELIVPLAERFNDPLCHRTTILCKEGYPHLRSIHRVSIDDLPILPSPRKQLNWMGSQLSFALSDRESQSLEGPACEGLVQVKHSLITLFMKMGLEPDCPRVVGLSAPDDIGIYTIIVVNDLRMDLASHTPVADVCILSLTDSLVEHFGKLINSLTASGQMLCIPTEEREVKAWNYLLPAFVERCRTNWSHKSTCEYVNQSRIPLSISPSENPLCSCGAGRNLGTFGNLKKWNALKPFMSRAILSPLYALSWMEKITKGAKEVAQGMDRAGSTATKAPSEKLCAFCNTPPSNTTLLKCSACKMVEYCGRECQTAHWKTHKSICKQNSN